MSPSETILKACQELREKREAAQQGTWEMYVMDGEQTVWVDRLMRNPITIHDMNFIDAAANNATQLASALEVTVRALEAHKSVWANAQLAKAAKLLGGEG